jgi:putative ABC transport system permease protein
VFGGVNSVGKSLNLDGQDYRIVGVLDRWDPVPKFYDLTSGKYSKSEDLLLPFTAAIQAHKEIQGNLSCKAQPGDGWDAIIASECLWTQFWVELPTPADARAYRTFLANYASEQQRSGRLAWLPHTQLLDVKQLLSSQHVVSDEVQILVLVSFSFLVVCLLNAMGLLLAKIMGRSSEIGVRRALGASRREIFAQCLVEAGVIGLAGGLVGLGLVALGLQGLRVMMSDQAALLTHLDPVDVALAITVAIGATMLAGLYPTWRAAQVQPAWQLKTL